MWLGSVYYYALTGSYWSFQSKILAKDGVSGQYFGSSVSVYDNNVLIGAYSDDDKGFVSGLIISSKFIYTYYWNSFFVV
jgi:hypothetical protein